MSKAVSLRPLALGIAPLALSLALPLGCGDDLDPPDPPAPEAPPSEPVPTVREITAMTAGDDLIGGMQSIGGVGDFVLRNEIVHAVVDRPDFMALPPLQTGFSPGGCSLVDYGNTGADNDQLFQLGQAANLSPTTPVAYLSAEIVEHETQAGVVGLQCTGVIIDSGTGPIPYTTSDTPLPGTVAGVEVVTTFWLGPRWDHLKIETLVTNSNASDLPFVTLSDAWVTGVRSLQLFIPDVGTLQTPPEDGSSPLTGPRGFEQPPLSLTNPSVSFVPYVGARGTRLPEASYALASSTHGMLIALSDDDDHGGEETGAQFVTTGPLPVESIAAGTTYRYHREFFVTLGNGLDTAVAPALNHLVANVDRSAAAGLTELGTLNVGRLVGHLDPPIAGADVLVVQTAPAVGWRGVQILGDQQGLPLLVPGGAIPYSQAYTDAGGGFDLTLPLGTYDLVVTAPGRAPFTVSGTNASVGGASDLGTIPVPGDAPVTVSLEIWDETGGSPRYTPARLTFAGLEGTPSPNWGGDVSTNWRGAGNIAYTPNGRAQVTLAPGKYRVWASRGIEYSIASADIDTADFVTTNAPAVSLRISDVFSAPGVSDIVGSFVSGDFHVHSGYSFDSSLSSEGRVISFLGEGVDVLVSTEHDFVFDHAPALAALSSNHADIQPPLSAQMRTMVGIEITGSVPFSGAPKTIGHWNGWPVRLPPEAAVTRRNGAPNDEYINAATVHDILRGAPPSGLGIVQQPSGDLLGGVVQLNHPRAAEELPGIGLGFFANFAFMRESPVAADGSGPNGFLREESAAGTGTQSINFDTIEILNAAGYGEYLENRQDWFSLLNQGLNLPPAFDITGLRKVATGNSDTHRLSGELGGLPRNYVFFPPGLDGFDADDLATGYNGAILGGGVIVSNGPFVNLQVINTEGGGVPGAAGLTAVPGAGDGGPAFFGLGQTASNSTGTALVALQVVAPMWVPIDEVRIVWNGEVVMTLDSAQLNHASPVRYATAPEAGVAPLAIAVDGDGWFVAEAGSTLEALTDGAPIGGAYGTFAPGHEPVGFTNPVFVNDTTGSADYQPPGL